jgi:hypothetical protein
LYHNGDAGQIKESGIYTLRAYDQNLHYQETALAGDAPYLHFLEPDFWTVWQNWQPSTE